MRRQVAAVTYALAAANRLDVPMAPVLCSSTRWGPSSTCRCLWWVRLESPKTLRKSIVKTQVLDTAEIDRSACVLGAALPAKWVYRPASAERTHASLVLWRLASS